MSIISSYKKAAEREGIDNLCNSMTYDELSDLLTDIINERESYPENTLNQNALFLDDFYAVVSDEVQKREKEGEIELN